MHKIFFIIFLLLLSKNSFSQNYIEIYRYGILGQMYNQQERPDSAEKYLIKALALMPDKTIFPCYFSLIKIADTHKDTKKIAEYIRELSCIYPRETTYKFLKDYSEISMDTSTFKSYIIQSVSYWKKRNIVHSTQK
jgi:tetratricopeptide (TPR) repeat protein